MVLVVRPQPCQPVEILRGQLIQHRLGPFGIVPMGGGHDDAQQQPHSVKHDMAFAPLDQFAAIGAVLLPATARLDRLTVDESVIVVPASSLSGGNQRVIEV